MARSIQVEYPGAICHITCRMIGDGQLDRSRLFVDDQDRKHFLDCLADRVEQYNIRLYLFGADQGQPLTIDIVQNRGQTQSWPTFGPFFAKTTQGRQALILSARGGSLASARAGCLWHETGFVSAFSAGFFSISGSGIFASDISLMPRLVLQLTTEYPRRA